MKPSPYTAVAAKRGSLVAAHERGIKKIRHPDKIARIIDCTKYHSKYSGTVNQKRAVTATMHEVITR